MKVLDTAISGVKIIEPDVFKDARGYFCETYNAARYKAAGITADFVQDNESFSQKGVVRNAPQKLVSEGSRASRRLSARAKRSDRKGPRLMFNDPAINIEWPKLDMPIFLSEKDQKHPPLANIEPYTE